MVQGDICLLMALCEFHIDKWREIVNICLLHKLYDQLEMLSFFSSLKCSVPYFVVML